MPANKYKALLIGLKGLVYLKRGLVWLLIQLSFMFIKFGLLIKNIFGFRLFKIGFRLRKLLGRLKAAKDNRVVEFFGKRWVLQIMLFSLIVFLMAPHSNLYTRSTTEIAGRGTLLYKIIGPGEQDFQLEEMVPEIVSASTAEKNAPNWKEGAVSTQPGSTGGATQPPAQQDIAAISAGGTALSKPTILPGAVVPGSASGSTRTQIVFHSVQAGDTIGGIASKYGISIATILWANNLSVYSYIRPGDQLKIPPISGILHTVKKGDTITKIAKLYRADAGKIIKFNKLKEDGSDVVIGESLIIPDGLKPQPVYSAASRVYSQLSSISAPPPSVAAPAGSGYLWPTTVRRITQYFGWRHTGLDIGGPVGTAIYASKSGTITRSQCGWNGGYGCYIIIDHGGGMQTLYGHNSRLYAKVGEQVLQGQTIALMGSTGRSTGPHVHFEVRINGRRVNPLKYVK